MYMDVKTAFYGREHQPVVVGGRIGVGGKDIPSVAEMTGLSVRADMPEEDAYKITKAICEGQKELVEAFATWGTFTVEGAAREMAYPLHPGAARYYKEIGVLK